MLARLLSFVLLAAIGLPTIAPALALAQDPDAGLPACCRRHGQHHCSMMADRMAQLAKQSSQPQMGAVCPCYPHHEVAPVAGAHLFAFHASRRATAFSASLSPAARAQANRRASRDRSHYKRGPPSTPISLV